MTTLARHWALVVLSSIALLHRWAAAAFLASARCSRGTCNLKPCTGDQRCTLTRKFDAGEAGDFRPGHLRREAQCVHSGCRIPRRLPCLSPSTIKPTRRDLRWTWLRCLWLVLSPRVLLSRSQQEPSGSAGWARWLWIARYWRHTAPSSLSFVARSGSKAPGRFCSVPAPRGLHSYVVAHVPPQRVLGSSGSLANSLRGVGVQCARRASRPCCSPALSAEGLA